MKSKQLLSFLLFMSILYCGCEKESQEEFSLLGEWKAEYEIIPGTNSNTYFTKFQVANLSAETMKFSTPKRHMIVPGP